MKNLFKRSTILIAMIVMLIALGMPIVYAASAVNNFETFQISTFGVVGNDGGVKKWDIARSSETSGFFVKSITITQTVAGIQTAQDVTLYKNFSSSSAATVFYKFAVPATVGTYPVYPLDKVDNQMTNANVVNLPYFAVRASTGTNVASGLWCNVEYWK